MKKSIKYILIVLSSILIIILGCFVFYLGTTKNVKLNQEKLINLDKTVSFYDQNGNFLFKESDKRRITKIENIPSHVKNAFIAVEDKRFYKHNGIDYKGLTRAMANNLKSFSFKEGGSTITQQLIKNTHLDSEKTIQRKLNEIKLAKQLEKTYSKTEILEKYLNTIYFGDNCYGITDASHHYFGKSPENLTVNESAILAGIIKAPSNYSPTKNINNATKRKNLVLKLMHEQGYINKKTLDKNLKIKAYVNLEEHSKKDYDFFSLAQQEFNEIMKNYPYWTGDIKVFLTIDENLQKTLENTIKNSNYDCDKSSVIIDKNGQIKAYYSTCGNIKRQLGSTLKPLISYAPAIENNIVYSCSPILDEKTNFNGYIPKNYNEKYYGNVSVKDSLAKSLNVCAVKLLNYTGVYNAKSYVNKTGITLTENDNSLCLALGSTEKGSTLTKLCSSYSVFLNEGNYTPHYTIKKIINENNKVIFNSFSKKTQVFSPETTYIVNDMMKNVVQNGTAKKLSFLNFPLYAKTGTVGLDNGNTDAYTISYNPDFIVGVWFGKYDNSLMSNTVTGGTLPCILSNEIWKNFYSKDATPKDFQKPDTVIEKYIDKIEYENNNVVCLANDITPERYKIKALFKKQFLPKNTSTNFKEPKIDKAEVFYENNQINISLCVAEYYNVLIYKTYRNNKFLICDFKQNINSNLFVDKNVKNGEIYQYSLTPYYYDGVKKIFGKEIYLNKIKTPTVNVDDWWKNDL